MLIVPYFTRVEKSFEVTLDNIKKEGRPNIETYESIAQTLKSEGITHHKEMKRAGEPIGLLRVWTAAGKEGYNLQIVDGVYEGWNQDGKYFDEVYSDHRPYFKIFSRIINKPLHSVRHSHDPCRKISQNNHTIKNENNNFPTAAADPGSLPGMNRQIDDNNENHHRPKNVENPEPVDPVEKGQG